MLWRCTDLHWHMKGVWYGTSPSAVRLWASCYHTIIVWNQGSCHPYLMIISRQTQTTTSTPLIISREHYVDPKGTDEPRMSFHESTASTPHLGTNTLANKSFRPIISDCNGIHNLQKKGTNPFSVYLVEADIKRHQLREREHVHAN